MRMIKAFIVGLLGLFFFVWLLSLLIPSNIRTVRTNIITNTSFAEVKQEVFNLTQWKKWHPVFKSDSTIVNFSADTTKLQFADVQYKRLKTHIEIERFNDSSVFFKILTPGENDISSEIRLTATNNPTIIQVDWIATTHLKWYPWEKFYGIFLDKLSGPGYDEALAGLKEYLEKHH
ncbi:MAG: hypothetical protein ACOYKE_12005 [Ferruginibacter sp.]